ncbi:hypothetical protein PIB30_098114, partial [Stylosanthes scabra]|nr:hypothetical protein [Stylosanthes scabra]
DSTHMHRLHEALAKLVTSTHSVDFHAYVWALECLGDDSLASTHRLGLLSLCVGSGVGWKAKATPMLPGVRLGVGLTLMLCLT